MDENKDDRTSVNKHQTVDAEPLSSSHLQVGDTLLDRYTILRNIAEGGMGVVFEVEHVTLKKHFALKLLRHSEHCDSNRAARFQNEARATSILNHANIVSVVDFGIAQTGQPYLVMELLEGQSLAQLLLTRQTLTIPETIDIFLQIAKAMAYAHEHQIIHRDLKPSNIMLCPNIEKEHSYLVKVLDFGISKVMTSELDGEQGLTRTGEIFGSPFYMSPEQGMSEKVDARADIYSFGCSMYECLTGAPPFVSDNALSTLLKHQRDTPLSLKEATLGSNFPKALESMLIKLLKKNPQERYQSMHEVEQDMSLIQSGEPLSSSVPVGSAATFGKPDSRQVKYVVLVSALVAAVGVALPFFKSASVQTNDAKSAGLPSVPRPSVTTDTSEQTGRFISDLLPTAPFAKLPIKKCKTGPWLLQFPNAFSLGGIRPDLPPDTKQVTSWEGTQARGTVTFSQPRSLELNPSAALCNKPSLFRLFRADEISNINFDSNFEVTDDTLLFINHLTGIRTLELYNTEITDAGLEYLTKLHNLINLNVSRTKGVTGNGLAKLQSLRHMQKLDARGITQRNALLTALKGSSALQSLALGSVGLTDNDLKTLATCTNLTVLDIPNNPAVTDAGISNLVGLRHLTCLTISGCSVTSRCLSALKKLHLRYLTMSRDHLTPDEIERFSRDLSNCSIELRNAGQNE